MHRRAAIAAATLFSAAVVGASAAVAAGTGLFGSPEEPGVGQLAPVLNPVSTEGAATLPTDTSAATAPDRARTEGPAATPRAPGGQVRTGSGGDTSTPVPPAATPARGGGDDDSDEGEHEDADSDDDFGDDSDDDSDDNSGEDHGGEDEYEGHDDDD